MNKPKKHVHFVGITGSGIAGVARAAHLRGYKVTGCSIQKESPYTVQLEALGIIPMLGHDKSHLEGVDIVATTPATLYRKKYKTIPELVLAKKKKILMKWQTFWGEYICKGKESIAVASTHGKTTSTALLSEVLEKAKYDPTVFIGGIDKRWNASSRVGKSDWFVMEADEYDYNFIDYHPKYVLLNNIEMEHPEIFKDFKTYQKAFRMFLLTIRSGGKLVFNLDNGPVFALVKSLRKNFQKKKIKLIGFSTIGNCVPWIDKCYQANEISYEDGISFVRAKKVYHLNLLGAHNVSNALGVLSMVTELGVKERTIQEAFEAFRGAERRLDLILELPTISVYNDYAHHHTQVNASIDALRRKNKQGSLIAILEPHLVSRLENNTKEYFDALNKADEFFIMEVYRGREENKTMPNVPRMIKKYSRNKGAYVPDYGDLLAQLEEVVKKAEEPITVLIMGAGNSHHLASMVADRMHNLKAV